MNTKRPNDNLKKGEQRTLKELSKNDETITTNADKGGTIVIIDIDKYISEAQHQLNDKNNYKKLQTDPTLQHNKLVNDTVERFKKAKSIPTKIADGLITSNPQTPKFCISPKIHKENNPGWPVISSINCHTSKISKYVDYHIKPIMKEIPSYIKDTDDFINKINNHNIPKESIFVRLDVKSLYTSIPNPEGIAAVEKAHKRYQHKTVRTKKGHNYFFRTYFDLKQLHIQFKVLLTNKRMCSGYYLCSTLCKYLYGLLRKEIHLPIN